MLLERADIHSHMLLLGEDGVVGLKVILLEELLAVRDLHVKQGIAHAEQLIRLGRHGVQTCVGVVRKGGGVGEKGKRGGAFVGLRSVDVKIIYSISLRLDKRPSTGTSVREVRDPQLGRHHTLSEQAHARYEFPCGTRLPIPHNSVQLSDNPIFSNLSVFLHSIIYAAHVRSRAVSVKCPSVWLSSYWRQSSSWSLRALSRLEGGGSRSISGCRSPETCRWGCPSTHFWTPLEDPLDGRARACGLSVSEA